MKILILLFYFILLNLYSKNFEIEIFFSSNSNDVDIIEFPNNTKYQQIKNTANWQNTYGDYGILKCDKLIRFENYNNEARTFLSDLGIGDSIPHIHKTNVLEYKDYYDDKSRSIVSEIYKKDLLHFGYEF